MKYVAFQKQAQVHLSKKRIIGAFAGKRGGKTELGAIQSIMWLEQRKNWKYNGIDPFIGVIIAPTYPMLERLSMQKFLAYAKPFRPSYHKTSMTVTWPNKDPVVLYGISADKPQRLEGIKANFIWIDEVFQVSEQIFLEAQARVSDQEGLLLCTGSLGVQYNNPKNHWVYRYFKDNPSPDIDCFEWTTCDNPHFPQRELRKLKNDLDPRTFRQMFEIDWNVPGKNLVYENLTEDNFVEGYVPNPGLPVICSIDWGWTHPMSVQFFQHDPRIDTVYCFDEIVRSKMTLDHLYHLIKAKNYNIHTWICDIAGTQEREGLGKSNVQWFQDKGIRFKYSKSNVAPGLALVRSYVRDGSGRVKLYIDEKSCPKTVDALKNYSYDEKNGIMQEVPVKKDDDPCDSLRYFFVNYLDKSANRKTFNEFSRWGKWQF